MLGDRVDRDSASNADTEWTNLDEADFYVLSTKKALLYRKILKT